MPGRRAVTVDADTLLLTDPVRAAWRADQVDLFTGAVEDAVANLPGIAAAVADKVAQLQLDNIYKSFFSVKAYGAKGDGTTNDATAVQAAVNACRDAGGGVVFFPAGLYVVNATITTYVGIRITGAGKGTTGIGHAGSSFLFDCQSTATVPTALYDSFGIEDLTIYAANGFRVNNTDSFNGTNHQSNYIMGMRVRGVRFANAAGAAFQTATNAGSSVIPTATELRTQGVGLMATGCYDAIVENCNFGSLGIGIFFDGCDVSTIRSNRFEQNSRHIHLTHHSTEGARITIERNDILTFWRMGGIYANTDSLTISNNYFEPIYAGVPNTVAQILRTDNGDRGLRFLNNSIDCGSSAQPLISISGNRPTLFDHNNVYCDSAGLDHVVEVRHDFTSWDITAPTPVFWGTNTGMNRPKNVAGRDIDSYVLTSGNIPAGSSGGVLGAWPFATSPVTGREVVRTDVGDLSVRFVLQNTTFRNFTLFYTGRRLTGPGYRRVTYTENGQTATVVAGATIGFTSTTGVQTKTDVFALPSWAQGTGYFDVAVTNREIEYERIQLQPMS